MSTLLVSEVLPGIHRVPGYQGAYLMRRAAPDGVEFVTLTLFDCMDAVRAFAGDDPERAVYYPEDDRYLVERSEMVEHYRVD